jgi:hypothetical protein
MSVIDSMKMSEGGSYDDEEDILVLRQPRTWTARDSLLPSGSSMGDTPVPLITPQA